MTSAALGPHATATPDLPVTTVFARRVRPGHEGEYEAWVDGIARTSSGFPGYAGTTVLRPGEGREEYVHITQFGSEAQMRRWLDSPERAEWLEKLASIGVCRESVMSLGGMERWFTLPGTTDDAMPPRYKTAVLVFLGLYPTVFLLDALLGPALRDLPAWLRILTSLAVSVPVMVWGVMPGLTHAFRGWLHPQPGPSRTNVPE